MKKKIVLDKENRVSDEIGLQHLSVYPTFDLLPQTHTHVANDIKK